MNFLLYSNIFIGACAVALAFTNQLTTEGNIHFDYNCWFILFSTIFTYSYLKITGGAEGQVYKTTHRSWAAQNPQLSRNILLISLIGTIAFFFKLPFKVELVVAGLGVLTAFYGFVQIPFTNPKIKLRDLGIAKTVFVGIVWSVTTVIVPLNGEDVASGMLIFLLLRRFLFIMALTMVFEIKDMKGDEGYLKTLPIAIGVKNTKLLGQGILFALVVINAIQYFFFEVSLYNMLAVNLSLLVSIACIQPVKEDTPESWYYFVLDGMMILQFVFVYAATQIFK